MSKQFYISEDVIIATLEYLNKQPFGEVSRLIQAIQASKEVIEEVPGKERKNKNDK